MNFRVISGGQTGVDQGALFAAFALGIPTGGYAPKGWMTEDGPAPWLAKFGLSEHQGAYAARTRANIAAAGMTIILMQNSEDLRGGTELTLRVAKEAADRGDTKLAIFHMTSPSVANACRRLVRDAIQNGVSVINVAGPRGSKRPGIQALAEDFCRCVFACREGERINP